MKKVNLIFRLIAILFITNAEYNLLNGQSSSGGNIDLGGYYLGFSNAGSDLNFTMTSTTYIQLNNTSNSGFVGIGTNLLGAAAPAYQLDVEDAININTQVGPSPTYYMIDGKTVLHNYSTDNIFM